MPEHSDFSGLLHQLQSNIDRLHAGDTQARSELIQCACERMLRLTRKMLRDYPGVRRWEETDDVFQNASLRLCRALEQVMPGSVPEFIRLAALQIRRELIDLARHYFGPEGMGANHASNIEQTGSIARGQPAYERADETQDQDELLRWTAFHEQVQALDDAEREVFDLLWYQGLSQAEAAEVLQVSERTIQRRWQQARLTVHRAIRRDEPEF